MLRPFSTERHTMAPDLCHKSANTMPADRKTVIAWIFYGSDDWAILDEELIRKISNHQTFLLTDFCSSWDAVVGIRRIAHEDTVQGVIHGLKIARTKTNSPQRSLCRERLWEWDS
jgi:hypothetical protein